MECVNAVCEGLALTLFVLDKAEEYDLGRWDEWSGPVPEWYSESLIEVIQVSFVCPTSVPTAISTTKEGSA